MSAQRGRRAGLANEGEPFEPRQDPEDKEWEVEGEGGDVVADGGDEGAMLGVVFVEEGGADEVELKGVSGEDHR